jgi:exopolyphosphatase/guanosine-5'-triphosphate,3'-diphosphate pyrophosphatase
MLASIDIGTHSVLMLIGEEDEDGSVRIVDDRIVITRLGQGLMGTGIISEEAMQRTFDAIKACVERCMALKVSRIKAVGTQALRKAKNSDAFVKRVKKELGLTIEVISGEKEARLTYEASAADFGKDILVMDIGGGSTEFISGPPPLHLASVPIGSVSITDRHIHSDPVSAKDEKAARKEIKSFLKKSIDANCFQQATAVATAGTATTLLAMHYEIDPYDGRQVHGQMLTAEALSRLIDVIRKSPIAARRRMKGLMPERAEVIFAGAIIMEEAIRHLALDEVTISDRGVRWGVFYEEIGRS